MVSLGVQRYVATRFYFLCGSPLLRCRRSTQTLLGKKMPAYISFGHRRSLDGTVLPSRESVLPVFVRFIGSGHYPIPVHRLSRMAPLIADAALQSFFRLTVRQREVIFFFFHDAPGFAFLAPPQHSSGAKQSKYSRVTVV